MEKKKVAPIISLMLLIVVLIASVFNAIGYIQIGFISNSIANIVSILITLMIIYYAFLGYKKPHGNLLRYTFLVNGLLIVAAACINPIATWMSIALALSGVLSAYIGGRLDKIEKNRWLMILALVFMLVWFIGGEIVNNVSLSEMVATVGVFNIVLIKISAFGAIFQWIALSLVYISRYKEHKEAGLADAPKA